VQALQHPGIWATLRGTMAEEGVVGLYRGCAPTLLVSCPGGWSAVQHLHMCGAFMEPSHGQVQYSR
jgi:hypothetical protein